MTFEMKPIANVSTARRRPEDDYWGGGQSSITLLPEFPSEALAGLDAFSHVEVVFVFHHVEASRIITGTRHPRDNPDWPAIGIFAQRAKNRPNRIGCTICPIERVTGRTLYVRELDAIDGTPVLDLKPVMVEFLPRTRVQQPMWASDLMKH
jgi:tRNA-Thr(GGU) m(6)t(6)A37 methyltransferase TsaA